MIWFNPPCNVEMKMNIGKIFLKLVRKHFHKRHPYRKIFNSYTIKLSYSCTPNVKNLIKQHNTSIMKSNPETNKSACNCRTKDNCTLDWKCLSECIVYEATVLSTNQTKVYFGTAEGSFRSRYNNHTKSFCLRGYEHVTELSKHNYYLNVVIEINLSQQIWNKSIPSD